MMLPTLATLPTEPSALLPTPPETIGRFQIRTEIGRGSNGVVYSAHDPVLAREVAIKVIPLGGDSYFRDQIEANFLNEAKAAGGLAHPHIVTVFDAGKTESLAYMAMERLHGRDLHDVIVSGHKLPTKQLLSLMVRVADAVHYAHKRGLIHRDIKPSNIFLQRDGKPKVLDFGVALPAVGNTDATQRRQLIGTPNYMSPEQALGRGIDARSDVFSIGTILYELLGGKRAFDGKTIEETLAQVIGETPTALEKLRPDLPPSLVAIVNKALAKDVDTRFQTAGELRNELSALISRGSFGTGPITPVREPAWRQRLNKVIAHPTQRLIAAAVVATVLLALVLLLLAARSAPGPRQSVVAGSSTLAAPQATPVEVKPVTPTAPPQPVTPPRLVSETPPTTRDTNAAVQTTSKAARASELKRTRDTAPVIAPPLTDGFLSLAITPWGEVIVDGISRGVSPPLNRLALEPGIHTVEIRNGAATPFRSRIEIKPGQTISLQHRF